MRRRPVLGGRCRNSTTADTKYCGCTARGCGAMKVHFWHGQFCCSEVDLFSYFHCSSTYFLIFEAGKIKLSLQSVGMRLIICVCTANTRFAATTFYCCSSEIMAKPIYRPTVKQKQHFDCLLPRPEVSTIVCNYQRSCLNMSATRTDDCRIYIVCIALCLTCTSTHAELATWPLSLLLPPLHLELPALRGTLHTQRGH